jgi:hypothetical protein
MLIYAPPGRKTPRSRQIASERESENAGESPQSNNGQKSVACLQDGHERLNGDDKEGDGCFCKCHRCYEENLTRIKGLCNIRHQCDRAPRGFRHTLIYDLNEDSSREALWRPSP